MIGELAARCGTATSAIRYYEQLGLVEPAGRRSGRRLFAESAVSRVRAIAAAREAGFSLETIRRLLDSQAAGTGEWRGLVEAKIGELRSRIERLQVIEATLRDSLTCGCRAWDQCPMVVTIPCRPAAGHTPTVTPAGRGR